MDTIIVTIGDEILIGQVVDTNSSWIARQLNLQGIKVQEMLSEALKESVANVLIVDVNSPPFKHSLEVRLLGV